jgi:hypothetical protein
MARTLPTTDARGNPIKRKPLSGASTPLSPSTGPLAPATGSLAGRPATSTTGMYGQRPAPDGGGTEFFPRPAPAPAQPVFSPPVPGTPPTTTAPPDPATTYFGPYTEGQSVPQHKGRPFPGEYPKESLGNVTPARKSAYSMGAPALDDRVDSFGRKIPGAQTFVQGLFDTAENTRKAIEDFKKNNPNATDTDPQLVALNEAHSGAVADATAGSTWASMSPSKRQSILTGGEVAANKAAGLEKIKQQASENWYAEADAYANGRPTTLLEDQNYFNETGVMRGGAGENTSTTPSGAIISTTPQGGRVLESPYGKGSATFLTPDQMEKRPEAKMDGIPASEWFDNAARRNTVTGDPTPAGTTFDVGGVRYSAESRPAPAPGEDPSAYAKRQLKEANKRADEERRKFVAGHFNK